MDKDKNINRSVITEGADEAADNIEEMIKPIDFKEIPNEEPLKSVLDGADEAADNIGDMIKPIDFKELIHHKK